MMNTPKSIEIQAFLYGVVDVLMEVMRDREKERESGREGLTYRPWCGNLQEWHPGSIHVQICRERDSFHHCNTLTLVLQ